MNQFKPVIKNPFGSVPTTAQKIAKEFARIAELAQAGKLDEALRAAAELQAKHPGDATANFILAMVLEQADKLASAMKAAEAAVKLDPNNARYLIVLGRLCIATGFIEKALPVLKKAFHLDKSIYQAPWALASYYMNAGQGALALPFYELTLNAVPASLKDFVRLELAECQNSMGQTVDAEKNYAPALRAPNFRIAALTQCALLRKNGIESPYGKEVQAEFCRKDITDQQRSSLHLCLGRLYENDCDFDNAFLNFEKAKALLQFNDILPSFVATVDDIVKVFKRETFEAFKDYGQASVKPIFVVGMPRSGTTMTEQIISGHSRTEGVGELTRIQQMARGFYAPGGMTEILAAMKRFGPDGWKRIAQEYMNLINVLVPDGRQSVDKFPHNFLHLGFIYLCFPNAKVVQCTRNPLDNFISAFQNEMHESHGYSFDQVIYGEYYAQYLRLMQHWKEVLPAESYGSNYEDLTANPETEVRKILEFLELPWEEACLNFHERQSTVRTFSRLQVRGAINTASMARWRNYEKHLAPLVNVLKYHGIDIHM